MKKLLLSICSAMILVSAGNAQAPSYNMESWQNVQFGTVQDPVGWASFNILVAGGMQQSVYKETTPPLFQGTASAKIVTREITGVAVPGYDTVGLLILGKITAFPSQSIKYGINYTGRPATVNFATQYVPVGLDTGWVLVQLTKWNSTNGRADTIASGKFQTSTNSTVWTQRVVNMNYVSNTISPDTLKIYCSSSSLHRPKLGSTLWVDDFTFNGWVSTNDIDGVINNVSVFPNPANNSLSLECSVDSKFVEVSDIAGRKVGTYQMNGNKTVINTSEFSKGLYIYQVTDSNNKVLNRGKFEVAH
ncbi:MAG: hypothetical protein K0Q95_1834 [Bacteroidota bacterium]|jgi:hypothetical protein|nr:hypothetical protein [Bacteroidota bacterium]